MVGGPFLRVVLVGLGLLLPSAARADDAAALAKILTGGFSNERAVAAAGEGSVETLRVTPIWPGRPDGHWLYLEWAPADQPAQPSRQEVWHLRFQPHKGGTEIRVHTLPDPTAAAGAWQKPAFFRTLLPEKLTRIEGCELLLQRRREFEFSGGTPAMECRPADSDAAYHLVQAVVRPQGLTLWDRGFNAAGEQVSGPATEGVRYDKVAIGDVVVER